MEPDKPLADTLGPDTSDDDDTLIPPAAQKIIVKLVDQLRHCNDLHSILQFAIDALTHICQADRGLIWQIVGSELTATNECVIDVDKCFAGKSLDSQESTAIVLEFLSRFQDESSVGIISIPDTKQDPDAQGCPVLSSLIELGNVHARLLVQLRSLGIFSGFVELQQCEPRVWTEVDAIVLQQVGDLLSVVVQHSFDQSRTEVSAKEMYLINEVAAIFRQSYGVQTQDAMTKSVRLIAEHLSFDRAQAYLVKNELLIPQLDSATSEPLLLTDKGNAFVVAFESGRGKILNADDNHRSYPIIDDHTAMILPLISKGQRLGVIGLWQRMPNKPQLRPQDRELGMTIAGHLADVFLTDLNIRKLRNDVPYDLTE